jgi:predicted dehydrogenase
MSSNAPLDRPVRLILIGAGNRGNTYCELALERPDLCQVVAVAEPRDFTRSKFVEKYKISAANTFKSWKEIVALPTPIEADGILICTLDQYHLEPAIAFANLRYNILLEKPMSLTEKDCQQIYDAISQNQIKYFVVCHVLRYHRLWHKIKSYIHDLGKIGEIVNIQHLEPVGAHHYTHSYVRGNWKNSKWSSNILMAKSCHDIDLIYYMVQPRDFKGILSYIKFFRKTCQSHYYQFRGINKAVQTRKQAKKCN